MLLLPQKKGGKQAMNNIYNIPLQMIKDAFEHPLPWLFFFGIIILLYFILIPWEEKSHE